MKALVIANGCIKDVDYYQQKIVKDAYDFIICADGGLKNALRLHIIPDVVIGDFDSTDEEVLQEAEDKGVEIIRYPVEKDQTDTDIVLDYLIERDYTQITMIGCLGNRVDHSLGNIVLLKKLLDHNISGRIIDEHNEVHLINDKIEFCGKKGRTLSYR